MPYHISRLGEHLFFGRFHALGRFAALKRGPGRRQRPQKPHCQQHRNYPAETTIYEERHCDPSHGICQIWSYRLRPQAKVNLIRQLPGKQNEWSPVTVW